MHVATRKSAEIRRDSTHRMFAVQPATMIPVSSLARARLETARPRTDQRCPIDH
jgi:hypothetical protein